MKSLIIKTQFGRYEEPNDDGHSVFVTEINKTFEITHSNYENSFTTKMIVRLFATMIKYFEKLNIIKD